MAAKRRNDGYSASQRADGRWMARVTVGYNDQGHAVRKHFYGPTRAEVVRLAQEFKVALDNGGFAPTDRDCTVGQWLERWLDSYVTTATHAPKTVKSYREQTKHHLLPALGKVGLRKLTAQHVQKLLTEKSASGLSPASVANFHRVLRAALSQAHREGLVSQNVAKLVRSPRIEQRSEDVFSVEDLGKLFKAAEGHHLEYLFRFEPYVGLRVGEVTGLTWNDVDFESGVLTVRRQLQWENGKPTLRPLKSRASKRQLALADSALEVLRQQRALQMVAGFPNELQLVFVSSTGSPLDPKLANKWLKTLCLRAGIKPLSFHKFRHTAATLLLASGENPSEVMRFLGHSQIALTVNLYGHTMTEAQRRASNRLASVIENGFADGRSGRGS